MTHRINVNAQAEQAKVLSDGIDLVTDLDRVIDYANRSELQIIRIYLRDLVETLQDLENKARKNTEQD